MPSFPKREADAVALADAMIAGYPQNPSVFPTLFCYPQMNSFDPHSAIRNPKLLGGAFGSWEQAGMALETHTLLSNQSQRRQIEYRIIAVNSAGVSIPSNTAAVVL